MEMMMGGPDLTNVIRNVIGSLDAWPSYTALTIWSDLIIIGVDLVSLKCFCPSRVNLVMAYLWA